MRLIDAEKLENDITENITTKAISRVVAILQGQPTVKAIPKEWIEKWLEAQERIVLISPPYYNQVRVPKMLEDWEEENEESN